MGTSPHQPYARERQRTSLLLWLLQMEFPGSQISLLQEVAVLQRVLPSTQAARRIALANALYLQGVTGQRMLPVLLVSLGQTAAERPAAMQRLPEAGSEAEGPPGGSCAARGLPGGAGGARGASWTLPRSHLLPVYAAAGQRRLASCGIVKGSKMIQTAQWHWV